MTTTQKTTRTPVQYNSSGAAAGFGPQAHPPHMDAAAEKTIQDKTKGNSDFHGDNAAFIKQIQNEFIESIIKKNEAEVKRLIDNHKDIINFNQFFRSAVDPKITLNLIMYNILTFNNK